MNVIFLDIDGVLNRTTRFSTHDCCVVESDLLDRFRELVRTTGAKVVLTSTWRHEPAKLAAARELGIPFDDVAPDLRPRSRGEEVKTWLVTHAPNAPFAVLDDDQDGYDEVPLFQPDPTQGLTDEIAAAIVDYLQGRRKNDFRRSLFVRFGQWLRSRLAGHRG